MVNNHSLNRLPPREKDKQLQIKRSELRNKFEQNDFMLVQSIGVIAKKAARDPNARFDDLIRLISDEGILFQAMGNISKKKEALTPGSDKDKQTVNKMDAEIIYRLANQLRTGTFRFKPIKRIYMDKSGKKPPTEAQTKTLKEIDEAGFVTMNQVKQIQIRPIGIASFTDKIVQEAMRIILNAIYEPEFAKFNVNFGFRPKNGCHDAIENLLRYGKQMDYAIEGDITGAFDNFDYDLLIEILRKKIADEKFIKLIRGSLKCGLIYINNHQETIFGTVQGSVVSPLLYNIYFNEFDKYITTEFTQLINNINEEENRVPKPANRLYNSITKRKLKLGVSNLLKERQIHRNEHGMDNHYINLTKQLSKALVEDKKLDKLQKQLPAFAKSRQTIRFVYTRYADNWVLLSNAELSRIIEWKEMFSAWISTNLKLVLSEEKTKITDLRKNEKIHFLGFQLCRQRNRRLGTVEIGNKTIKTDPMNKNKIVTISSQKTNKPPQQSSHQFRFKSRANNPTLITTWDRPRILPRLEKNGFIVKKGNTWRGRSKLPWTTLTELEIVQRYNYIIRGYLEYYIPVITYPNDMLFLWYLLYYSCTHTLAQKRNSSLKKIFRKFGRNLNIKTLKKTTHRNRDGSENLLLKQEETEIITWEKAKKIMREIIIRTRMKQKYKKSVDVQRKN